MTNKTALANQRMSDWDDANASEDDVRAEADRIAYETGVDVDFDEYSNPTFMGFDLDFDFQALDEGR
tara:strand:+ start:1155 stop:1355 length:201 start_codon:yes stop_codon:yes gene_type:complete